ncbi:MAG: hypothetical protein JWN98_2404 [Abditibacteriota bacterium]|nr:hypothetical protein [Abditibacteriota bacterium]
MKTFVSTALAAVLLVGAASTAKADLTNNGAVGLPLNPTAQIPQPDGARVQANYYDLGNTAFGSFKQYGLYAAGRLADRFEISGGVEKMDAPTGVAGLDNTGLAIGAKYLFSRETEPAGVRLAVGAGYSRANFKNVHGYVVASKYLGTLTEGRTPITGHLGLRYDRFSLADIGGGKSNKASVYAGVEVPFTPDGSFQFVGEVQSKNISSTIGSDKIPFSASLRYRPAGQGFSVSGGVQRQGLIGEAQLFVQLGYSFATTQAGP